MFSKDLYYRHVKPGLVWERVNDQDIDSPWNMVRKGENADCQLFFKSFLPIQILRFEGCYYGGCL